MPMESNDPATQLEQYKALLQKDVENHKYELRHHLEQWKAARASDLISFRAVIDFANSAIKLLVLVNGGAVIAILTFLGNLVAKQDSDTAVVGASGFAITYFVVGLAAAVTAAAAAYLSQVCFTELSTEKRKKGWGNLFRAIGLATALVSLICFSVGAWVASDALTHLSAATTTGK
ncbi:MAG: hypothetical protein KGI92_01250 [Alphaproteobacteria bacterium]|nr:hypothetical protein [Alphaproteobacteria bacterium]